jgi:putative Mg2+ transporter-C (MgtC) family protein
MYTVELQFIGQVALALLLGAILGWQRERIGKPAGLRTYALVSAGSAIFTIVSSTAFGGNEPTRIAAQIVSGIGFIGAGAILHNGSHIEGITTAAGLWVAAAIGMATGTSLYLFASASTLLFTGVLLIDEKKWFNKKTLPKRHSHS